MIALISRDAGGAEFISRYVKNNKKKFCIAASGPAVGVFKKNFSKYKNLSVEKAILMSDLVLCSTGTSSDYEKRAMYLAKKHKKKTIAYIDHWVQYRERFLINNKIIRPDEIWVSDTYALLLAKKKNLKNIKIKGNPLLADFKRFKKRFKKKPSNNILFLSEPVSKHLRSNYDEFKCIKYFIKNLKYLDFDYNKILIRPHPSETVKKFNKIKKISKKILISKKNNIFYDILNSKIIVGINSIALLLGLIGNKKVISCIPGKKICELPHKGIIDFRNFLNEKKRKN